MTLFHSHFPMSRRKWNLLLQGSFRTLTLGTVCFIVPKLYCGY